jgi:hypothetical protein
MEPINKLQMHTNEPVFSTPKKNADIPLAVSFITLKFAQASDAIQFYIDICMKITIYLDAAGCIFYTSL